MLYYRIPCILSDRIQKPVYCPNLLSQECLRQGSSGYSSGDSTEPELRRTCLFEKQTSMISVIILCLLVFMVIPVFADSKPGNIRAGEENKSQKTESAARERQTTLKDTELRVTSDTMLVEQESSVITFSGNVVAIQGESIIKADKISVALFTDKEKRNNSSNMDQGVKSITASGDVELSSGSRTASADQAVYTSLDQKIVLTGDSPRVTTGESYVTGKKIVLFQNSGRVIVEGGKERRVEALFNSKDDFRRVNGQDSN